MINKTATIAIMVKLYVFDCITSLKSFNINETEVAAAAAVAAIVIKEAVWAWVSEMSDDV